LKAEIIIIIL